MSITNNNVIATNKGDLNIKEIIIFSLISFLILGFFVNWILGIVIGLLNFILYTLVRFSTWVFYKEVKLHDNKLFILNKFLTKSLNSNLITSDFDNEKLHTKEVIIGGRTKFILQYKTHKEIDLLIVDEPIDQIGKLK